MNAHTKPKKFGHGSIKLPLGWRGLWKTVEIHGGPYNCYPGKDEAFGVSVRKEQMVGREFDLHLPIDDFHIPRMPDAEMQSAIVKIIEQALAGKTVYVGCMGGYGRTGLFLALVAKAAGVVDPVEFIREHYSDHAVETNEQHNYVEKFDVKPVQDALLWAAFRQAWLSPWGFWAR